MENNNLQHAGIKGMRWGVRRYQNKDGSLTPAGKKRYGERPDHDDDIDEAEAKKQYEEGKQRALKSGSAEEILKYKGDLTNKELTDAYNRLIGERNIESLLPKKQSGIDKFSDIMGKVDTVRSGAEKAVSAYNLIAKVNNTFNDRQLPTLDGTNKHRRSSRIRSAIQEIRDAKRRSDTDAVNDILSGLSYDEVKAVYDQLNTERKVRDLR